MFLKVGLKGGFKGGGVESYFRKYLEKRSSMLDYLKIKIKNLEL